MAEGRLRKVAHNAFVLSPLEENEETFNLLPDPLVEAHYLYIPVPFQDTHVLTVSIGIVPFSMPDYRGQLFYHAEAFYSQCCQNLDKTDFMCEIASIARRTYSACMRCHIWNFEVADAWRKVQVPEAFLLETLTCSERSALILNHLIGVPEAELGVEEILNLIHFRSGSDFHHERSSCLHEDPEQTSRSLSPEKFAQYLAKDVEGLSTQDIRTQGKRERSITNVAERFLDGFRKRDFSGTAAELRRPVSNTHISGNSGSESATRAFQCCKSMFVQAKEQLKHTYFTRFISLCFFLLWEALACEPGKAGARVINAKMKEAGFEGPSRSLKNLRDETVFINQLVASIEAEHGIGVASLALYHIFDSSNYHLIRLMNRYGTAKKRRAIRRICEHLDVDRLREVCLPVLRIHEIMEQQMSGLRNDEISLAIGYQVVDSTIAIEQEL